MKYPKLFEDQPEITKEILSGLEKRGLLVAAKSLHKSEQRTAEVTNRTAGDVIGYSLLSKKFKERAITQADARILLVIESTRAKGPRDTHTARLILNAFVADKSEVLKRVESWAKNH